MSFDYFYMNLISLSQQKDRMDIHKELEYIHKINNNLVKLVEELQDRILALEMSESRIND